jgi:hypothetical protein
MALHRAVASPPAPLEDVHYPESDGKPVAETDIHIDCLLTTREVLRQYFLARDPMVYVAGNLFVYYERGNPKRRVAPDVFVVRGVPAGPRRVYKVWEEGRAPDWVLEVTSRSTRREDMVTKRDIYAALGVREYFLFDPLGEYLRPRLQGFRLIDGSYEPMTPRENGSFLSDVLGLELHPRGEQLRLYVPQSGEWLLTYAEQAARAEAAEAEAARLRAELARLRGQV